MISKIRFRNETFSTRQCMYAWSPRVKLSKLSNKITQYMRSHCSQHVQIQTQTIAIWFKKKKKSLQNVKNLNVFYALFSSDLQNSIVSSLSFIFEGWSLYWKTICILIYQNTGNMTHSITSIAYIFYIISSHPWWFLSMSPWITDKRTLIQTHKPRHTPCSKRQSISTSL